VTPRTVGLPVYLATERVAARSCKAYCGLNCVVRVCSRGVRRATSLHLSAYLCSSIERLPGLGLLLHSSSSFAVTSSWWHAVDTFGAHHGYTLLLLRRQVPPPSVMAWYVVAPLRASGLSARRALSPVQVLVPRAGRRNSALRHPVLRGTHRGTRDLGRPRHVCSCARYSEKSRTRSRPDPNRPKGACFEQ